MAKTARWKIKIEKEKNNHGKKDTNSAAKKNPSRIKGSNAPLHKGEP
jgi:hypothetical protein